MILRYMPSVQTHIVLGLDLVASSSDRCHAGAETATRGSGTLCGWCVTCRGLELIFEAKIPKQPQFDVEFAVHAGI
jgi:hypothetical protein